MTENQLHEWRVTLAWLGGFLCCLAGTVVCGVVSFVRIFGDPWPE